MIEDDELCELIPHSGSMCLLQRVLEWDEQRILCESLSHKQRDNPLLRNGCLSSIHALEYGAQAMAVHGGLLARKRGEKLRGGYLAALREVKLRLLDLSQLQGSLLIEAVELMSEGGNLMYSFQVTANGEQLVTGRATVIETR